MSKLKAGDRVKAKEQLVSIRKGIHGGVKRVRFSVENFFLFSFLGKDCWKGRS